MSSLSAPVVSAGSGWEPNDSISTPNASAIDTRTRLFVTGVNVASLSPYHGASAGRTYM
ncbi:hypothetical protein [Sorangium sp. So ce128]|uniref:hypothetical protein n=1 Tax=Sorangium sp. So ce128 TaxID=3133281 RepID=UPI003F62BA11